MIKIFNTRLLALVCFIMSIGLVTSCKKDNNDTNSGQVQLLSFGPTGAKIGDTLSFIGHNLNVVTEVDFTGTAAVVPQSSFVTQTSDLIKLVVPKATEQGFVTLKTPQGNIVTKTKLNLNVTSMVSSMTLQARPGENITITGNYLNWVTRVTFAKDKNVDSFVSKAIDKLVVTVPADAQTGTIVLSYGGTKPLQVETVDTLRVALPSISSVSPVAVKHGTNLTITGTNLDLAKQVLFTGDTTHISTFVSRSQTQLVVKVPASTTKGKFTLFAQSGVTVTSSQDVDVILPAVSSLAPISMDSLTNLTITGTNLDLVSGVKFTGVATPVTTFVSQSATSLVVKAPSGALKGTLVLNVLNSTLKVITTQEIKFNGVPDLTPFKTVVYDEALNSGWQKWDGWGTSTQDLANTEHPQSGAKAFKITWTDGYGGVQFHPASSFPLSSYTAIRLSVYGGANAVAGSKIVLFIKSAAGVQSPNKELVLKPGAYTTYEIPLSQLGNPTDINELNFQNQGTANLTVYVDDYGLF